MPASKIISNQRLAEKDPLPQAVTVVEPANGTRSKRDIEFMLTIVVKILIGLIVVSVLIHCASRVALHERLKSRTKADRTILIWDSEELPIKWSTRQCGCIITNDRYYANGLVDAVVFNANSPISLVGLDQVRRTPDFLAVYAARKPLSLSHDPLLGQDAPIFNYTMTYRQDSNIVWSDYYVSKKGRCSIFDNFLSELNSLIWPLQTYLSLKTRMIFYMVYEVNDSTLTDSLYLQELRKHLNLDAFIGFRRCENYGAYKFMLIFEPSACPDYVHPDFYNALANYVVPVVIGGGNISHLVPPNSYVNGANFSSPKELAKHLVQLSTEQQLYKKFFAWHFDYQLHSIRQPYCTLCCKLRLPRRQRQPDEFRNWWLQQQCPNRTDLPARPQV